VHLRSRTMQPKDVRASVAVVAESELERKTYGSYLEQLPAAWTRCLREESMITSVFEDVDRISAGVLGVGASVFVSDEFAVECKTAPLFWLGPKLVERISNGESPVLGPAAIRQENSGDGLNLLVWAGTVRQNSHVPALDLTVELGRAFYLEHRGYRLKEIASQSLDAEIVRHTMNTGSAVLLDESGRQVQAKDISADFITRPFLISATRELARQNPGSRNAELFFEGNARNFFSPGEQRLLLAAIRGGTDEELSEELGLSVSAVKKLWRSVYDRVARTSPDLLPGNRGDTFSSERGKEKKQKLLAYLREHPRELRPLQRPRTEKK
jgi:DNA-binding NarL/FixJ family response regulator